MIVHKRNESKTGPKVSLVLLDWTCREKFFALEWLSRQNVPRDQYEVIWVELYNRVVPEVMEKADVVITCEQKGMYHKHVGYNAGLLHAQGQVITVCDSDAVYPPDFISSIITAFKLNGSEEPAKITLMHYEQRTRERYSMELLDINELQNYSWLELWPNVGACMSVRRSDAIHFGGFDEHPSFRGYFCGPYDLAWRLVNAGIPEIWHDKSVTLWHFAHPDPPASFSQSFSWKLWREVTHPHIKGHALAAVEAFSTGRLLPLKENPELHKLRMEQRRIGTEFEKKYATMTRPEGFTRWERTKLHFVLILEPFKIIILKIVERMVNLLKICLGARRYEVLRNLLRPSKEYR